MTIKKRMHYEVNPETRNKNAKDKAAITFSERFEEQLHENDFHQITFSEKSGLSSGAISQYCNGASTPGFYELRDIATTLNISSDYLLGLSKTPALNKDVQSIAKYTGLSETSIDYLTKISKETTSDIKIPQKSSKKIRRRITEAFNNNVNISDKYKLHALNFILENDEEYNFLELIGKYLFSTTVPYRSLIDIIEEASDRGIPRDNIETKSNAELECFKELIQEILYIDISAFDEKQSIQPVGKLSQNEIHNAILVSLNNALSEANKKIKQKNKEQTEKKIEDIARNYKEMYNNPYFNTAVSLEEDIITFLQNSDVSPEQITKLQEILSDYINNN